MRARFVLILSVVILLLGLMQVYLYGQFTEWLALFPLSAAAQVITKRVVLAVLFYLNLSIPIRIFVRVRSKHDHKVLKYLFYFPGTTWLVTMLMMFTFFVARDAALWLMNMVPANLFDRRTLMQWTGTMGFGAPLIMTGYGALKTARDYRIENVEIPFDNLPSALDGFTIAQISDIHSGLYMNEREMERILEILNSLHPQMAALTGDYVDSLASEIAPVARVFSRIKTDFGVFACMGNHDLFDDYSKITQAMRDAGIQMLDNENRVLRVNGENLNVVGVGDSARRYDFSRFDQALEGTDPEGFKLLLVHKPTFFERACEAGIDLQLSGHTHGGQIALNVMGFPVSLVHLIERYAHGLYKEGKSRLYVNSGVGMVVAPIRLGVPPEITVIKLRRKL